MKKFLIILFPTLFYLATGQFSQPLQQFFAGLFVALTAVFYLLTRRQQTDQYHVDLFGCFKNGMLLLGLLLILCSAFPVGGFLNEPLILPHSQENADAIVVLASGATRAGEPGYSGLQRVTHGIQLLQQNRAPKLVISTGFTNFNGHAEGAWVASYTRMFAIDQNRVDILVSKDIVTTATEAEYIHKLLAQQNIKRILLVTSNGHIYRSVLVFAQKGFEVLPAPVHNKESVYYASENNLGSLYAAVHEWLGLIYYSLLGRI